VWPLFREILSHWADKFRLFLCFFVWSSLFASFAKLRKFDFASNRLTVFDRKVIDIFALRACQLDQMVL
jgi:hypothetical protein